LTELCQFGLEGCLASLLDDQPGFDLVGGQRAIGEGVYEAIVNRPGSLRAPLIWSMSRTSCRLWGLSSTIRINSFA
jgi:hypothetical protein